MKYSSNTLVSAIIAGICLASSACRDKSMQTKVIKSDIIDNHESIPPKEIETPAYSLNTSSISKESLTKWHELIKSENIKLIPFEDFSSWAAEKHPITHQDMLPKNLVEPWKTDHWFRYSGIYEALEVDGTGSARIVLTAFAGAKDAKLISACIITVADTVVEPFYQIHGSISASVDNGELDGYSIDNWKMIRYIDPITKEVIHGLSIDGKIYVDRSKNLQAEQGGTGQPATRPESKSEGGDKPQPEAEGRSR